MIKETKYNGFSAVPADYECPDGDLSLSLGVIPEDGALKPILAPAVKFKLGEGEEIVFIHKTSGYEHYITRNGTSYTWFDKTTPGTRENIGVVNGCINVTSVGNTLIFLTETGVQYYLWKGGSIGYLYLGSKIPECPLAFGLQGELVRTDEFTINFNGISEGDIFKEFSDDNKTKVTDQVLAKVNKFIAEESTNKGRFIYPFFIRYAYRLYDGSLTMHSAPILMIASSDLSPQVFWNHIRGKGSYKEATMRVVAMVHKLDYAVIEQSYINNLSNWKDIVRSVDIFCSKPIYTYDQNGKCERFAASSEIDSYCVCKHTNQAASTNTYPLRYQKHTFNKLYAFTYDPTNFTYPAGRLILPRRSVDAVKEDIKSTSQFYMLESIKIEALTTSRTLLDIEEDYLQSLVTREVMTDDYDSHDTIVPRYAFAYNSRLNIANIKKMLFSGYNAASVFCYTDGYVGNWNDEYITPTYFDDKAAYSIYIYIKQDGRDIIVKGDAYQLGNYDAPMLFIYYPNVNAYKAVIVKWHVFGSPYEVQLEQHGFLNGSFYFGGWDNPEQKGTTPTVSSISDRTIDVSNKIYTSEVGNPFYFPVLGINSVGTGEIKGICSAVKALSQGQFGQFPLYAFTTEGVWALEVSSTGTYSAKQPVTRDVCINSKSITQTDSAVLFATDRGIMQISGSTTQCLTDTIDTDSPFSLSSLPGFDFVLTEYNRQAPADDKLLMEKITVAPFRTFLANCRMIYDYTHQRIVVYNPNYSYAYVFSIDSRQWGMMRSDIQSNINSYPDALAMDTHGNLVDFSSSSADGSLALVVTRPFKFGQPDLHKTIDTIIQRGTFHTGHVSQLLYGSNNLYSWHVVWSSRDHFLRGFRGTPYKYFRLVLVCNLQKDERIYGFTTSYTPRLTNRPR